MDATNLATMFAPNLLHAFPEGDPTPPGPTSPISGIARGSMAGSLPGSGFSAAAASLIGSSPAASSASPERMEYVNAIRLLIERRDTVFELPEAELHDLYQNMWENCADVLDVMLRRRLALAGQEYVRETPTWNMQTNCAHFRITEDDEEEEADPK